MMRIKKYLLRDELLNDCFFVKAILDLNIKTEKLINLIQLSLESNLISLFTVQKIDPKYVQNFIEIVEIGSHPLGIRGPRGMIGPGDDGFGGRYCGAVPCIRQYFDDPYDILMALFIRADDELIKFMLQKFPSLNLFLRGTLELFLIDEDSFSELKRISEYVYHEYAYNFSEKRYPNNKEKYLFLKKEDEDQTIKENQRFLSTLN